MSITRLALILIAISLAALAWRSFRHSDPPPPPPPQLSTENLGELVTLRLHYANVLEFFQKRAVDLPFKELSLGGTRILMVVRGDCEVSTDLQAARYEQVQPEAKSLRVILPAPRMRPPRVSHATREAGGSYFFTVTSEGLEALVPNSANHRAAINNGWAAAETDIGRYCSSPQWIAEAKKNAEKVLTPMFTAVGWSPTFVWR